MQTRQKREEISALVADIKKNRKSKTKEAGNKDGSVEKEVVSETSLSKLNFTTNLTSSNAEVEISCLDRGQIFLKNFKNIAV